MWSNGAGMPPKPLSTAQSQFDELLAALCIPATLAPHEKLARLRATPARKLLAANEGMRHHEFRAWSDDAFVRRDLFADIDSGAFAARMRERHVQLLVGECAEEHFVYGQWRAPKSDTRAALVARLEADYPASSIEGLMDQYYSPDGRLPTWQPCGDWADAFGRVYADLQVHAMERGFVQSLIEGGAGDLVHRYRIEWRAKCVELPKEWGVTHSSDMMIWFWGNAVGAGLEAREKDIVGAFVEPFGRFLEGGKVDWAADASKGEVRRLNANGKIDVWVDDDMERALKVWSIAREAQRKAAEKESEASSKL